MVKKYLFVALIISLATLTGAMVLSRLLVSEEARIRHFFSETAALLSKDEAENPAAAFALTAALTEKLHDPCMITLPEASLSGEYEPRELANKAVYARTQFSQIDLQFRDLQTTLVGDNRAETRLTVLLTGYRRDGRDFRDLREIRAVLLKIGGDWRFKDITAVEVLKR